MKIKKLLYAGAVFLAVCALSTASAHAEESSPIEYATGQPSAVVAETPASSEGLTRTEAIPSGCKDWNSGYLCAVNRGTTYRYLNVKGSNPDWGNISGAENWNDRADDFYNGGKTSTARVWADANYKGDYISLPKGTYLMGWFDVASSNDWV